MGGSRTGVDWVVELGGKRDGYGLVGLTAWWIWGGRVGVLGGVDGPGGN